MWYGSGMDELEKNWLMALSAPMAALNIRVGAHYRDIRFYPDMGFLDLNDSWGINDRTQLLDMIQRMTDNGHANQLADAYWQASRLLPGAWAALLESLDDHQQVLHRFAAQTLASCGTGGIYSWDLGRMSFLARIGVLNGWLEPQESLWIHTRLGMRARYYYGSWNSYNSGFLLGYSFWQNQDEEPARLWQRLNHYTRDNGMVEIADNLLRARHLLAELPWDGVMIGLDKPQSLEAFDWQ